MIIGSYTLISTKRILKSKGFVVSFLNNEIKEMKDLYSLIKFEQNKNERNKYKILFSLNIISWLGFIGWILLLLFTLKQ
jgi:hypothetical protein